MKPTLKAPGSERLKLEHEKLLSHFAFKFNLRRYNTEARDAPPVAPNANASAAGKKGGKASKKSAPLVEWKWAGNCTRPLFSSTSAVLVTPPRVPLSNRPGENHAPNVSNKMCLR